jgi:hypothetical protein
LTIFANHGAKMRAMFPTGGAIAVLSERCANRSNKSGKDVVSISLTFSKAVSDPLVVSVQGKLANARPHAGKRHRSLTDVCFRHFRARAGADTTGSAFATVILSRKGKLCASANLTWGDL